MNSDAGKARRFQRKFASMTLTLLIVASLTGCSRFMVIPADKAVIRLKAGKTFTPAIDGWFYPDALHQEIGEALDRKADGN